MAKVSILEQTIDVWRPYREGLPHIAMINGFPMAFKASTAMQAKRKADDFRLIEHHRIVGDNAFPDEHRDRLRLAKARSDQIKHGSQD